MADFHGLDERAQVALLAVPRDVLGTETERFLDLIIDLYSGDNRPGTFAEFVTTATERRADLGPALARLADSLRGRESEWSDAAERFVRQGPGSNLVWLAEQLSTVAGPVADPSAAWRGLLDWAHGRDYWAAFDGGQSWPDWRAAFLTETGNNFPAALDYVRDTVCPNLDAATSPADRLARLAACGFTVRAATGSTWEQFIAAHNTYWTTWTGADWPAWRAGFLARGTAMGLAAQTEAALAQLDDDRFGPVERMTYLRGLGLQVNESAPAGAATPEQVATAVQTLVEARTELPDEVAQLLTPEVAQQLFADIPDAAMLSAEDIAAVVKALG